MGEEGEEGEEGEGGEGDGLMAEGVGEGGGEAVGMETMLEEKVNTFVHVHHNMYMYTDRKLYTHEERLGNIF